MLHLFLIILAGGNGLTTYDLPINDPLGINYHALENKYSYKEFQNDLYLGASFALGSQWATGKLLKPAADYGYELIDNIPEFFRRPVENFFGMGLDFVQSAPAKYLNEFNISGELPDKANIEGFLGYQQDFNGCGETAIATVFKNIGHPISSTEIENNSMLGGGTKQLENEFWKRGYLAIGGRGNIPTLKAYIAAGFPVIVNFKPLGDAQGHYSIVHGYNDRKNIPGEGYFVISNYFTDGILANLDYFTNSKAYYSVFEKEWKNRNYEMVVVIPKHMKKFAEFIKDTSLRRPNRIYDGFTISNLYIVPQWEEYGIELAFKYKIPYIDLNMLLRTEFYYDGTDFTGAGTYHVGGSLLLSKKLNKDLTGSFYIGRITRMTGNRRVPVEFYTRFDSDKISVHFGFDGAYQFSVWYALSENVYMGMNSVFRLSGDHSVFASLQAMNW